MILGLSLELIQLSPPERIAYKLEQRSGELLKPETESFLKSIRNYKNGD